jgi:hypothetical protein
MMQTDRQITLEYIHAAGSASGALPIEDSFRHFAPRLAAGSAFCAGTYH